MILTCPACATRYLVDPAAIGTTGRTVRCARCQKTWHQDLPPDQTIPKITRPVVAPAPPVMPTTASAPLESRPGESRPGESRSAAETEATGVKPADRPIESMPSFMGRPEPLGDRHLPALASPRRRISPLVIGWAALALFVILLAAGLVLGRNALVSAWPPAERLYALVRLDANPANFGLAVRNLNSARTSTDSTPTLVVAGEVTNVSSATRRLPPLRVSLRNSQNQVIKTWDFTIGRDQLLAGETAPFQTSIANPPTDASSALVAFTDGTP
jgi:predicted Zn finger-like uncharacterized protein